MRPALPQPPALALALAVILVAIFFCIAPRADGGLPDNGRADDGLTVTAPRGPSGTMFVVGVAPPRRKPAPLLVERATARFTAEDDTYAPLTLVLRNTTGAPLTLVSATSPVAEKIRFLAFRDYGPLGKQPLEIPSLEIPAKARWKLSPGNLEVRLDRLKRQLAPSLEVPLELRLADGSRVSARITITLDDKR